MQYLQLQYKHKQIEIKTSQISYHVMILTWLININVYILLIIIMNLITILHTFGIIEVYLLLIYFNNTT